MAWSNTGGNKSFRDRRVSWTCEKCGRSYLSNPEDVQEARGHHQQSSACTPVKDGEFVIPQERAKDPWIDNWKPRGNSREDAWQWPSSFANSIPKRHSAFRKISWKFRRWFGFRGYRRRQIKKIHVFLIIWIAAFVVGFILTSMSILYMLFVSLMDAFIIFVPLFILWWLSRKRTVGKVIAAFLIIVFAAYVYQYPHSFAKNNMEQDFFYNEGSLISSVSSSMNLGAAGGGNRPSVISVSGRMVTTSGSLTVLGSGLQVNFQARNGTIYSTTVDSSGDYTLELPSGSSFSVYLISPLLGSQIQLAVGTFNSGYSNTTYNITCQNNSPNLSSPGTCSGS